MWDTGIADRLRAAGLNVVEIAGWQTRGSTLFDGRGSLDHHTAGSAFGNAPSLNVCIYGRADLPGPLCQVLIGRDNTCYVIAAGKANHAGTGSWQGLTGNKTVYGIERENVGTTAEPWRPDQTDVAARAHAALIRGRAGADMVCRHAEWTPRKVDTHSVHGPTLRAMVANYLIPQEDTLSAAEVAQIVAAIDDTRPYFARDAAFPHVWIVYKDSGTKRHVKDETMFRAAQADRVFSAGVDANGLPVPWPRSKVHLDTLETVGPMPDGWETPIPPA